jgi:hypothetical protein
MSAEVNVTDPRGRGEAGPAPGAPSVFRRPAVLRELGPGPALQHRVGHARFVVAGLWLEWRRTIPVSVTVFVLKPNEVDNVFDPAYTIVCKVRRR